MNFRDFKFGDSNDPEEEWKIKFREDVRQRIKTGLSWQDYQTIKMDDRNEDE